MTNTLLYTAFHFNKDSDVPPCLITITECNEVDSFGSPIIAKLNQRFARPNKQFNNKVTIEMFKGKQGIKENFYTQNEIVDYLKMLTDEGYNTRRMTSNNENELADALFDEMYRYNMQLQIRQHGMKLPS